ncbi:MAG: DUF2007 domain-containing protein [Spirochaetales bacterium]|nr:DUF2007 domain-containing protein [Spirochaetales bacterium]
MKTVFTCAFLEDAVVLQSMLASAGIPAEVLSDSMLDINPYYSLETKGARIIVPNEMAEDAMAIVREFEASRHRSS